MGPTFFTVEPNFTTGEYTVRAASAEGGVLWNEAAPGLPLMGDSYGALVAGVEGDYRCALYWVKTVFALTRSFALAVVMLAAVVNTTVVAVENLTVGSTVWLPAESGAPGR